MQSLIIFRNHLLPASETFVLNQGEGLRQFVPYYLGARLVKGLNTPPDRTLTINRGGIRGLISEALFVTTGIAPRLLRELKRVNPVIVHAHFGPDAVTALPLARFLNIPLIVTFHGYDATIKDEFARKSFHAHRRYLRRRRELIGYGARFIAVSEFVRDKLLQQGYPLERTVVNYVGVDTEVFKPDPAITREPLVLFVGRLVENKGGEYFLKAMSQVQRELPDARICIVGDGPHRRTLEILANEYNLNGCCFMGMQDQTEVRRLMNRAKVFSVPSITIENGASEGFGLVFAEAQSMGLPVVSFRTGGIPEAVADGVTGILAQQGDVAGLADGIFRLLTDDHLWNAYSDGARKRVCELFDLRRQTEELEGIYRKVIEEYGDVE